MKLGDINKNQNYRHIWLNDVFEYWLDTTQRSILFLDALRKRGNNYIEHIRKGKPPVLAYDYEMVMDGREFEVRPVNYALVRIIPEKNVKVDPKKRPLVIIDPRAGHGPGIGGFKRDSEIGAGLNKGHPVYFVIFYPDPIPNQTLADVQKAEVKFIEKVINLHPKAEEPSVIGNCQGGWASILIGADRPDVTGPMVIAGSPLSYWSGVEGVNPMRYKSGLLGGIWFTSFLSDLGNGKFDGAHLVTNFEDLNPANTYWTKLYNLYSKIDTEEERFLNFEKWWGGFYSMTAEEIHFITESLFVGNKLEQGTLNLDKDNKINIENIEDPVVVFASKGDNITPPQQALNWIVKVYGTVEEIKRQQQILVYMVHEEIGHLGIFVSSSVAKKEHQEIVESLDQVEFLPPGLYEMVIEDGDDESKEHNVRFEEREIEDILALDDGFSDEEDFRTVAAISEINDSIYQTLISPWVKLFTTELSAEVFKQLHSLRISRYSLSDYNPFLLPIKVFTPIVKANRFNLPNDNIFRTLEKNFSNTIKEWFNFYRDNRDQNMESLFKTIYGNPMLKSLIPTTELSPSGSEQEKTKGELDELIKMEEKRWLDAMDEGGFVEGVFRITQALAKADQSLDRSEFSVIDNIRKTHDKFKIYNMAELKRISKEQSRILQTDQDRAIEALGNLLNTPEERVEALEIAQKIVMADGVLEKTEKVLQDKIKKVLEH
jgi:poly(3-hydroxyalkanoate) synthetase/tellurite resistance protein